MIMLQRQAQEAVLPLAAADWRDIQASIEIGADDALRHLRAARPNAINLIAILHQPGFHDALGISRRPEARLLIEHVDARVGVEDGLRALFHDVRGGDAGDAGHEDDIAFAVRVDQRRIAPGWRRQPRDWSRLR